MIKTRRGGNKKRSRDLYYEYKYDPVTEAEGELLGDR